MAPNLSLVCVLGALAGTSGQGTNSTTLSTSCTCTVDTTSVAELAARPVPTAPREETRFLFLLGYPHTGTSAMYFLLSTSASVTGIQGEADVRLGPTKEGMAHFEHGRRAKVSRRSIQPRSACVAWTILRQGVAAAKSRPGAPPILCATM